MHYYTMTKETYSPTASGKGWKSKPDKVETETIDQTFYDNYVNSIPLFNRFGHGAYCRGTHKYTCWGYIVTDVTSVSPFKETKIKAHFKPIAE